MFKEFSLGCLVLGSSLIWKEEKLAEMITRCHSLSFVVQLVVTRCTTRCHSLSLVVPLVVTRCTTRCHSLSLVVIRCHSLSFVVTRCTTRCHSLSLHVPLVCLFINDLNQKIITYILEFVFITQNHIFLSEIHLRYSNTQI